MGKVSLETVRKANQKMIDDGKIKKYDTAKSLVDIQEEYIKFLEREVGSVSSIASTHGWVCQKEVFDEGCKFRETIKEIKNKL
jgi:hypothetical protein